MKREIRVEVRMNERERQMLDELAAAQRRSRNDVIRLAVERVYMAEMLKRSDGTRAVSRVS